MPKGYDYTPRCEKRSSIERSIKRGVCQSSKPLCESVCSGMFRGVLQWSMYGPCSALEPLNSSECGGTVGGIWQNHTRHKILKSNDYVGCVSPLLAPIFFI